MVVEDKRTITYSHPRPGNNGNLLWGREKTVEKYSLHDTGKQE